MNTARQRPFSPTPPKDDDVEIRIARLESDVEHIKRDVQSMHGRLEAVSADVTAIKATLPHLATKAELRSVEGSLTAKITSVEGKLSALETRMIRWIVGTSIATGGLMLTLAGVALAIVRFAS